MLIGGLIVLLGLVPMTARADVRAIYSIDPGSKSTIEVADNGDIRADFGPGVELIVRGGTAYLIEDRFTGPLVTRVDDLRTYWNERARSAAGRPVRLPPGFAIVPGGIESVNGRPGRAYYVRSAGGTTRDPIMIVSEDPALARLGPAMAFLHSLQTQSRAGGGQVFREDVAVGAVAEPIMKTGAPLRIGPRTLVSVEEVRIPADRFALPAEPETAQAAQARLAAEARDEEVGPSADTMITRAAFGRGRLWLLTDSGTLSSLAEGEDRARAENPGGYVLDMCASPAGATVLTTDKPDGRVWTLRRGNGEGWQVLRSLKRGGESRIALSCADADTVLITSRRMIELGPAGMSETALSTHLQPALVETAYGTNEFLFLGLNAGEWGGGLKRIDRRSGRVSSLERNATGELCDGPLNSACDPVNGIATIPWKRDCVAAAIGLVHMAPHGRIVEICGDRIEQIYSKPSRDGMFESQLGDGSARNSVAFFGLVGRGDTMLAVGHDGLYRFTGPGAPAFQPLPRFNAYGDVLVSFALPDAILVITGINQRRAASGVVPIIVAR